MKCESWCARRDEAAQELTVECNCGWKETKQYHELAGKYSAVTMIQAHLEERKNEESKYY